MANTTASAALEEQVGEWRSYLRRRQAIQSSDVAELEDHLREQIAVLSKAGLSDDEAFLVAVKRMGELDALSREFAREHSDRLWKQLVAPSTDGAPLFAARRDALVAFALAALAALLIKLPALFGLGIETDTGFYARNFALFVLPLLAGYFAWKRQLDGRKIAWLAASFVAAAIFANIYPFAPEGYTELLTALHLPIALWLAVGIAYAGRRWGEVAGRMDFIRFSGELFIYYTLIALGGGVLAAFTGLIFMAIGVDLQVFLGSWLLPCGAVGAVLVGAWLVEAKQSVIENMAPVLTRLFTPLFAVVLVAFLATLLFTGRGVDIEREVLIAFDLLLVLVLGLLLYSISARDPLAPPGVFDLLQVVLVVSALVADAVALWAMVGRLAEFGVSPNRLAALGANLILLANLSVSAVHYVRFLRRDAPFAALERWQTDYLPVYAAWAAMVVILFPPMFGFV
jgi:hypothetical protein